MFVGRDKNFCIEVCSFGGSGMYVAQKGGKAGRQVVGRIAGLWWGVFVREFLGLEVDNIPKKKGVLVPKKGTSLNCSTVCLQVSLRGCDGA